MNLWQDLLAGLGYLLSFFYDFVPNYGLAIIAVTIVTRLVLLPLTIKQTRSMLVMQRLQPEIKKLQAKYKGREERAKLNEEMMALYKEHGANPLGGCLPILLQMPILFALFRVLNDCVEIAGNCIAGTKYLPLGRLRAAIASGETSFLGMQLNLTPNQSLKSGVIAAIPYFLLILFTVLTGLYQQRQMTQMQKGTTPQNAQMQMMGKIFPIMFAFFALNFPAGLSVYWVATNVWTIGQQHFVVRRLHEAEALKTKPVEGTPAPSPNGQPSAKEVQSPNGARPKARAKHKGEGARKKGRRR